MRRAGPSGCLIELPGGEHVADLARFLREQALPGVTDIVPGARTVLLDGAAPADLRSRLAVWQPGEGSGDEERRVEIPVVYDGPDLADVAGLIGLTPDQVVEKHTGADARVAFCGFAAGFAYITGLPAELHVPRLGRPRTAVEAGSVGLAAEFTGIYPRRSPGGWRLIGRTAVELWDERRDPPALLAPGTRVRFLCA